MEAFDDSLEGGKFHLLLISQAFAVVFLYSCLAFNGLLFIPPVDCFSLLILPNFALNMYGLLVRALDADLR